MIKIFYTSDIHGYVFPYKYHDNKEMAFGLAKAYEYIKNNFDDNSIYIDNGDVLEGSQLLDYFYSVQNREHPMKTAMNIAKVNYINLGNHDFNYGVENLLNYIKGFNCITSNVKYMGKAIGKSYIHEFKNGKKIGIVGVCTHYLVNWEIPENLCDIELTDAFETLKSEVSKLKSEVDYIIAVYHGGFEKDLKTGEAVDALNGENQAYQMCHEIEGIDVLLTGHQHSIINEKLNGVTVLQPSMGGEYLGYVEIDKEIKSELIKPNNQVNTEITKQLADIEKETQNWLEKPITKLNEDLLIKDQFDARLHKHKLVSLLNQVQLHYSGADFSAIALFNDACGFSKNLTMRELTSTYVYPNVLHVMETDYHNLILFLEKCAEYFSIENDKIVVNPDFYVIKKQHYNYDMVDGLEYTIKVSNPIGSRIINITKDGKPLDKDKKYTIVMNNYRSAGGGDFEMVKNMKNIKTIESSMVKLVYEYLKENPDLKINHKDNITIIK